MQLTISVTLLVVLVVSTSAGLNASTHCKTSLTVLELPDFCDASQLEPKCGKILVGRLQEYCLNFYQSKSHDRFEKLISRSKLLKNDELLSRLCRKQVGKYTNKIHKEMSNLAA